MFALCMAAIYVGDMCKHRYSISQMDVAPRQSFIAGIVLPRERTVMLGIVNVVKSLAASFGPLLTGGAMTLRLLIAPSTALKL